jgi:CubicO group peptidase (beta-lactamase class C family)
VPREAWEDHDLLRGIVCNVILEWTRGSRVHYHLRAAHWAAAVLIEAIAGKDYCAFVREHVIEPLGLAEERWLEVDSGHHGRCADMHEPAPDGARLMKRADENNAAFRLAGTPGGGGYGTARAMATFYQMLVQGGALPGRRIVSPRMVAYVTRNFTADRVDGHVGCPMHRGLGPHSRGTTETIRGVRHPCLAPDVRPRRRRLVVLLGRSRLRSIVCLPDQQPDPRPVAWRPDGPGQQSRPYLDYLTGSPDGGRSALSGEGLDSELIAGPGGGAAERLRELSVVDLYTFRHVMDSGRG